ncbi:MAG: hypothetical protein NC318_01965 [Blautia sp.]|nr:hypothetical protein [Lachnoclostridium sp.]MCM1210345.1 hypothetical protein [Blautia sp.]
MYTEMYIHGEDKNKRKKLLRIGFTLLWIIMIMISLFFTFKSLVLF